MKKSLKIVLAVVLIALAGGFTWWQFNKKKIIRETLEKTVSKQTDDLYFIKYDSSRIDEVNGNATFYNLVLQSDSLQESLYANDTASLSNSIINIRIQQLTIRGANIPALLQKTKVQARSIEIDRPVVTIINTGKNEVKLSAADSLALYDRITGKFKSIQAGEIIVKDGTIAFANGKKSPNTTLQGVNIRLENLKIDSTRNYDNLVSYFVKDVVATVSNINIKNEVSKRVLILENIEYNAPQRFLQVDKVFEKSAEGNKVFFELSDNRVSNLSTDAFVINKLIKADSLRSKGGSLSIYRKKNSSKNNAEEIEMDNEFFDQAFIKNISLGKTTLTVYDKANPSAEPLTIKNLQFAANGIQPVNSGTNIARLISNSNWSVSGDGVSFDTEDKVYSINIGNFDVNNTRAEAKIAFINVTPKMSEQQFMNKQKVQTDLFDLKFKQLFFTGLDTRKLFDERVLKADGVVLQPFLHIYNDRTLPPNTASKIGMYPHQMLVAVKMPVYINKVTIKNGDVVYKERGAISKEAGDVAFRNVNATISNVTNIPEYIRQNNIMVLNATTKFMGASAVKTTWKMPLDTKKGDFEITGSAGKFDATVLNPMIKPLGMATIRKGTINNLVFDMKGDDFHSEGTSTLLYNNLKVNFLKNGDDSIKKKGLVSFVANIFLKDDNPSGKTVRSNRLDLKRDETRSFFNLVWKSIFAAAKKTASGKNNAD